MAIATVDAVRSNIIYATILLDARGTDIEGLPVVLETDYQFILGRILTVDIANQMHANLAFKPALMQRGSLPYFSKDADYETAEIEILTCLDKGTNNFSGKRANPHSGTSIELVTNDIMQMFMPEKEYYAIVGIMPSQPDVAISVVNKQFVDKPNGFGEAKHKAFFGKNGSGKTVEALTQLATQLVAYPEMGCLIPDTAGDISLSDSHNKSEFKFSFLELLDKGNRTYQIITQKDIRLTSQKAFEKQLVEFYKSIIGGKTENLERLAFWTTSALFGDENVNMERITYDQVINETISHLQYAYSGKATREDKTRLLDLARTRVPTQSEFDKTVRSLFTGSVTPSEIAKSVLSEGNVYIVQVFDLDSVQKELVMYELFTQVDRLAKQTFNERDGQQVNGIVLIDEAPRWVPQTSNYDAIADKIKDAVKNTRKYGLGWYFISQRIADIDKGVFSQIHTYWFGRGLGTGADKTHMENILGQAGLKVYNRLNAQGNFFWVGSGHEINMGVGNAPVAKISFGGDATQAIIDKNPHIWKQQKLW